MNYDYDFAILGGGSAGYAAARTAVELGLKTLVIDGAEELGGLCILRGCMPSKTLIQSANRNLSIRRAKEFGLRASGLETHVREIRDRKRQLIGEFAEYRQGQLGDGRFDLERGFGRFVDAHTIEIQPRDGSTPRQITMASCLVATGSTITPPPFEDLAEIGYMTSDDILDAEELAESFIVLGGGAIALEMAHYLEGIGREITVIQRSPQLLKSVDSDVANALEGALVERGIEVYTGTSLSTFSASEGFKQVEFEHNGETKCVRAKEILFALGRRPATASLDLSNAGVETSGAHIATSNQQATSAEHIFAAGDVCGPHEVVHIAIEQGEAAATNAAILLGKAEGAKPKELDYRLKLFGVFTEPQVASVGISETEAKAAGIAHHAATYPFDDHGKSMTMGETHGFVKLICDADGCLLGGSAVGPEVVELIHEITVALHFGATAADLTQIPHYHPTLSEIWTYPAEDLAEITSGDR